MSFFYVKFLMSSFFGNVKFFWECQVFLGMSSFFLITVSPKQRLKTVHQMTNEHDICSMFSSASTFVSILVILFRRTEHLIKVNRAKVLT